MAKSRKATDDLVAAGMDLIAENGWRNFSLVDLARKTDTDLAEVHRQLPRRRAVLSGVGRHLDKAMLEKALPGLDDLDIRERLFDLMMRRFEAMQTFRPGLVRLARDARKSPDLVLLTFCNLDRMASALADAAGIRLRGMAGRAARRMLMLAYAQAFRVWLHDDSEDMAATMAEVDKRLGHLDRMAGLACRLRRRRNPTPEAAEAA
ncbi:MAG: hypothetical protein R3D03_09125 [Geminicoccaceae bacterium]|nr:hypothetical protein [Geminicoccaceae bacterium]